jgi:hypothetical protein
LGLDIQSNNWHKDLLNLSVQQKLISPDIYQDLKGFLAFRHFVRHAYSFEIYKNAIINIIQKIPSLVNEVIDLFSTNAT